jgi:hypothetical protein
MHAPLNCETVNDTAKLIMHRLVARALARDPWLIERAKAGLAASAVRFPDRSFIADWNDLLHLPVGELRSRLTSRSEESKRLRLSSPFVIAEGVDFTDATLRRRIGRAAKRTAARGRGNGDARPAAV